jgi:hypothetical protein
VLLRPGIDLGRVEIPGMVPLHAKSRPSVVRPGADQDKFIQLTGTLGTVGSEGLIRVLPVL